MSVNSRALFLLAIAFSVVPAASAQTQAIPFFDDTVVQQINLTVGASDWASLLQNYESDTYYSASFTWNGILEEVGIRQHGDASRSPIKPNLDINFAYYANAQTFLGLPFILLKANNEDPSNLAQWLSMKFFRMMGFAAPRQSFAQLYVNGQLLGFYEIVEHEDETFLQRNFGESGGYLYEWQYVVSTGPTGAPVFYEFQNLGNDPSLYAPFLKLKTNQTAPGLQTFCNLVQAINQPSSSTFTDADFIAAVSYTHLGLERTGAGFAVSTHDFVQEKRHGTGAFDRSQERAAVGRRHCGGERRNGRRRIPRAAARCDKWLPSAS